MGRFAEEERAAARASLTASAGLAVRYMKKNNNNKKG